MNDHLSHHHILSKLGMHPWRQEERPCPHTKLLPNIHQYSYIWCKKFGQPGFIPPISYYLSMFFSSIRNQCETNDFVRIEAKKRLLRQKAQRVALQLLGVYQDVEGMDGGEELQKYGEKTSWEGFVVEIPLFTGFFLHPRWLFGIFWTINSNCEITVKWLVSAMLCCWC